MLFSCGLSLISTSWCNYIKDKHTIKEVTVACKFRSARVSEISKATKKLNSIWWSEGAAHVLIFIFATTLEIIHVTCLMMYNNNSVYEIGPENFQILKFISNLWIRLNKISFFVIITLTN